MMYHENRRWCLQSIRSAEELAEQLLDYSWCCCCGFELEGFLWLNDSTSPDRAQEYAVVKRPTDDSKEFRQVESITVSWCDRQQLLKIIHQIHYGVKSPSAGKTSVNSRPVVFTRSVAEFFQALGVEEVPSGRVVHPRIETPDKHSHCTHCA